MASAVMSFSKGYEPTPDEPVMKSLLQQYERVIVESIVTSFGLDCLIHDQYGGDVDTIHNVREIGKDPNMHYKNAKNKAAYENQGEYDYAAYHDKNENYRKMRRDAKKTFQETGEPLIDAYTGKKLYFYSRGAAKDNSGSHASQEHIIPASGIHNDPGRVLAGLRGEDLANAEGMLVFTNAQLNSSINSMSTPEYIQKHPELPEEQKQRMMSQYNQAKKSYESKVARAYYSSPKFAKDLTYAATNVGVRMGLRQALGFVFSEMWFAVKAALKNLEGIKASLSDYLKAIGNGLKQGLSNAKEKYQQLFSKFLSGTVSGALSSITTSICNIFFTTAKNAVKIFRQAYVSIVEAVKILFINPDNYAFGDRMRAVAKALSVGASVVVGVLVSEAVAHTPLGMLGVVGDIVQTFCGSFVTGIMSCTLLMFLDKNELINKLVKTLNGIHTLSSDVNYYRQWAKYFEEYAAKLMEIDLKQFEAEASAFSAIADSIDRVKSEKELNQVLRQAYIVRKIPLPWEGFDSFDSLMQDKQARLVFQ